MTTNYPGALDTTAELKNDAVNATTSLTQHKTTHNNEADATIAIETELGVNPRGGYSSVLARLAAMTTKTPAATQIIQSASDVIEIALKAHASQAVRLFEAQDSAGTPLAWWDSVGGFNAQAYTVAGSALASTHLSDTANILKNPSPSITTPSISTATLTGVPTAPTPSVNDNTTKIATTAYVINQGYAKPASPAFTGTPIAPTAGVGTDTTQIATTAYTKAEIVSRQTSSIPVGSVMPFSGSSTPSGWLLCDGSAVSRTTYAALFAIVSTTYGVGDGSTTFNLPGLRGRMVVGKGTHADVSSLGASDGLSVGSRRPKHAHTHSLTTGSEGGHNHGTGGQGSGGDHSHTFTGPGSSTSAGTGGVSVATSSGTSTDSQGSHSHGASIDSTGGHTHSITGTVGVAGISDSQGYLTIRYMIKT